MSPGAFIPKERNVIVTNEAEGKVEKVGGHCDLIRWYQALAAEPPGPAATNSHNNYLHLRTTGPE